MRAQSVIRPLAYAVVFVFAMSLGLGSASAKHHQKSSTPADPCASMTVTMNGILRQLKTVNKAISNEQSAPKTLAGVFQLMQGQPYVDQDNLERKTRLRQEADDLDKAMRVGGCTPVDINAELAKPFVPTIH